MTNHKTATTMRDRDYYPAGAYNDPDAPYNEHEPEVKEWDCSVSVTLAQVLPIGTQNYTEEPPEMDEDGFFCSGSTDTSDVDWREEYEEQYMQLDALLEKMADCLERIANGEQLGKREMRMIPELVRQARGWNVDDIDISEI